MGDGAARAVRTAARGSPATPRPGTAAGPRAAAGRPGGGRRAPRAARRARPGSVPRRSEQVVPQRLEHRDLGPRQRLARPAPQHGAQLGLGMERHTVVDAVHGAARLDQDVAALAVGVVEDHVEHGHPAQPLVVGVRRGRPAHRRSRGRRAPAARCRAARAGAITSTSVRRVVVDGVDPELHHAGAERPLAQHGRRHDAPAGGLRHREGRDLAAGQGAVREVPQRPFAGDRLVDAAAATSRRARSRRRAWRWTRRPAAPRRRSRRAGELQRRAHLQVAHRPGLSGGSRWRAGTRARRRRAGRRRTGTAAARQPRRPGPG